MMTTLLHLSQTIIDMQQELAREQRFASDSCVSLMKGVALLREALDALERDIKTAFEERDRAVSRVLGNSAPYTTTIEPHIDANDPLGLAMQQEEVRQASLELEHQRRKKVQAV